MCLSLSHPLSLSLAISFALSSMLPHRLLRLSLSIFLHYSLAIAATPLIQEQLGHAFPLSLSPIFSRHWFAFFSLLSAYIYFSLDFRSPHFPLGFGTFYIYSPSLPLSLSSYIYFSLSLSHSLSLSLLSLSFFLPFSLPPPLFPSLSPRRPHFFTVFLFYFIYFFFSYTLFFSFSTLHYVSISFSILHFLLYLYYFGWAHFK